jgi:hypothetical protein
VADNLNYTNPGSGVPIRTFSDGTNDWQAEVPAYVTGGSAGAWTIQQVDTTHGLPVAVIGTVPVSGTITANAGTNLNTSALAIESGGHLASLDTKLPGQGQALAAASMPVVLTAAQITTLTPPAAITGFALETGGNLATIAGKDFATQTTLAALNTKTPALGQALAASSVPVVLTALQVTALTPPTTVGLVAGSAVIGHVIVDTAPTTAVTGTFWQATQPVSGTVTANLGTIAGTALDTSVNGLLVSQGSTTSGEKGPLVQGAVTTSAPTYTTAQTSPISIDTSGNVRVVLSGTSAISGTVTANAGTGTFAVSAASLPLPSGAATAAKQPALGTAGSASADVLSVQGVASMTALKVDGSAVTQPVSAASLPLPAGAATSALQSTGNTSVASVDTKTPALGQALAAASVPVVLTALQVTALTPPTTVGLVAGSAVIGAVTPAAATTGGATPYQLISAASTNATSVKASAGTVYGMMLFNANAAVRYVKFYDKASSPTVGTDTPSLTIPLPPTNGGVVWPLPLPAGFTTGIALAITTGVAVADTGAVAANDIVVNLIYK